MVEFIDTNQFLGPEEDGVVNFDFHDIWRLTYVYMYEAHVPYMIGKIFVLVSSSSV